MINKIPDKKIKELSVYFKSGDEKSYSIILNMLSGYIYNYPRITFGMDLDVCSDFYEYIFTRLKTILTGYRETDAKFITWFTVVLRNRYLNFIREKKYKHRVEQQTAFISLDSSLENSRSLYSVISDGKDYRGSNFNGYYKLIDDIVKNLKEKQRIFFHLYYIETLRPEDVSFISIHLDNSIRRSLDGISEIRNTMVEKYRLKNKLLQRLSDLYYDIIRKHRERNESEVEILKKKRNKVLEEYRRVKLTPSYESLSHFLGLPIGTVSTGIMRMKSAVRSFLKEHCNEEMPV